VRRRDRRAARARAERRAAVLEPIVQHEPAAPVVVLVHRLRDEAQVARVDLDQRGAAADLDRRGARARRAARERRLRRLDRIRADRDPAPARLRRLACDLCLRLGFRLAQGVRRRATGDRRRGRGCEERVVESHGV
jgi:hypothetical protein